MTMTIKKFKQIVYNIQNCVYFCVYNYNVFYGIGKKIAVVKIIMWEG